MSAAKKPNRVEMEETAGRDCYVMSSTGELGQNQKERPMPWFLAIDGLAMGRLFYVLQI